MRREGVFRLFRLKGGRSRPRAVRPRRAGFQEPLRIQPSQTNCLGANPSEEKTFKFAPNRSEMMKDREELEEIQCLFYYTGFSSQRCAELLAFLAYVHHSFAEITYFTWPFLESKTRQLPRQYFKMHTTL